VEEMARRGACGHFWQTYAWSKGRLSAATNIYQYKNGQTIADHAVDFNESFGGEGWWDTKPVEKPVDNKTKTEHWAQKDHDELRVAGFLLNDHPDLDAPASKGVVFALVNRLRKHYL